MNRVLYVSKSRLENTLEEYNTIYSSVTTWRSRMETQNSNIAASNEGATTETYTEKTTEYNDNELSDFSGHVNVMSCALVEALTKTRGLIARSEDFVNILKGESAESSDTYSSISSTGDIASYYDNFCSQEGFTGAIKDNTESITDLGIKEEENLTGIEDELKHLKTISVDISGYATHIRDCITKQNYTSPLYDSLRAYCIDVAVMHDYVKRIRDTYFPVLDGPREHNRSYNYDGAPTDDKENIYTSRIKELGFSERDIEVLKRYTGLTAEQLYNQLSHMPGAEIANMLKLAYANYGNDDTSLPDHVTMDYIKMRYPELTSEEIGYIEKIAESDKWNDETREMLMVAAAKLFAMPQDYDPKFVCGMLGNFIYESGLHGAGSLESSNYKSTPEPSYLVVMDEKYDYKLYSGGNIQDIGVTQIAYMANNCGKDGGGFGFGMAQWTWGRTTDLANTYKEVCGDTEYPSYLQCLEAETTLVERELSGQEGYTDKSNVYGAWENGNQTIDNATKVCKEKYEGNNNDTLRERQEHAHDVADVMGVND